MITTLAKAAMLGLVAVTAPAETADASLWAQWGLAGVVVGFTLWNDWQRERRMSAAIEAQQRWIRETLVETLGRNATAMERMATWLEGDDPRRASTHRLPTGGRHADHG